ncbi:hypothetical protein FQR65_LT03434 [Abscondita terminalis]|nr:hypothetical protein FQR65_LT03434 [Abscondita terminalis]
MSSTISGTFLLLIAFLIINNVESAPSRYKSAAGNKNCSSASDENENEDFHDLIDQRQNGTENYRISLKDFVFVWAPSDILLTAAALLDSSFLGGDIFEELQNFEKPQEVEEIVGNKPSVSNSTTEAALVEDDKITINSAQKSTNKRSKLRFPSLSSTIFKKP